MKNIIAEWHLLLRVVSESNSTEHWTAKRKRHKKHQMLVRNKFRIENPKIVLPCVVEFIRLSPRLLDDDNLRSAFKWIRDEIADLIIPGKARGQADSDPRIQWRYSQNKFPVSSIKIIIYTETND